MILTVGIDSNHLVPDLRKQHRYKSMRMNTGVNRENTMKTEVRMTMGSTMIETMGSTMEKNILITIIDQTDQIDQIDQTEGRGQEALAEIDITEEMTAQDKIETEEEKDQREDTAPMKEAKGDTLVRDEDTAQGPLVMLGLL